MYVDLNRLKSADYSLTEIRNILTPFDCFVKTREGER